MLWLQQKMPQRPRRHKKRGLEGKEEGKERSQGEGAQEEVQEKEHSRKEWEGRVWQAEFRAMTQTKLAGIVQQECPALKKYQERHVSSHQLKTLNLDNHSAYVVLLLWNQSLYPHNTVTPCAALVKLLEKQDRSAEAKEVKKVMDTGLSTFVLAGVTVDTNVKAWCFIRALQTADRKIIDHHDMDYREDQNIGLHDIVNQFTMCHTDTTQKVTISGVTEKVSLDVGYCPFCPYYVGCHRTLNNHVWAHLRLSLFCGIGSCFFTTHNVKALVEHATAMHGDVYQQSLKLT